MIRILASVIAFISLAFTLKADTILPPGSEWEYAFGVQPDTTWTTTTGGWNKGNAPFGNMPIGNNTYGPDFGYNTLWPENGILSVRTTIDLTGYDLSTIHWDLGVDNGFMLYVNGVFVAGDNAEGYTKRWEYSGGIPSGLLPGDNIIAVALEDHGVATAFDMQITGDRYNHTPDSGSTLYLLGAAITFAGALKRKFLK